MKVCIVHDSNLGNGKRLAGQMAGVLQAGGDEVVVGHWTEMNPGKVAATSPDLLIVGAAVRKFMTGPASSRWVKDLGTSLAARGASIPYAAVFITHIMPKALIDRRYTRFARRLRGSVAAAWYNDYFSGRVTEMSGPFEDGTLERAEEFTKLVRAWAGGAGA